MRAHPAPRAASRTSTPAANDRATAPAQFEHVATECMPLPQKSSFAAEQLETMTSDA
jgi:hypothetical protein